GKMIAEKLSITLCTDNRLVSHTTVCDEIEKTLKTFSISPHDLREIIIYGFKRSFSPLPYAEKRAYVRRIIDYYEKVEEKFESARDVSGSTHPPPQIFFVFGFLWATF